MPASQEHELGTAIEAVAAACRAIGAVGAPERFTAGAVLEKGSAGPVTVADLASQVAAVTVIRSREGSTSTIVGEETAEEIESLGGERLLGVVGDVLRESGLAADSSEVLRALAPQGRASGTGERFWTLDPLDGTKGYLRGGQFAVALALVERGKPVIGVLGLPRLGLRGTARGEGVMAWAVAGGGAFQRGSGGARPEPIRAAAWSDGSRIRLAGSVDRGHSSTDSIESALGRIGRVEPVRVDSQAKYLLVARGDADAYVRLSPTPGYRECIWDHAAGSLVACEAGCLVTDASGNPLDFSRGLRLEGGSGILCAPSILHGRTVGAVPTAR